MTDLNDSDSPQEIEDLEGCIAECERCRGVCLETRSHFQQRGGESVEPGLLRLLLDVAELCGASAAFLRRRSEAHDCLYAVASELARRCMRACGKASNVVDDPQLSHCAEACKRFVDMGEDLMRVLVVVIKLPSRERGAPEDDDWEERPRASDVGRRPGDGPPAGEAWW